MMLAVLMCMMVLGPGPGGAGMGMCKHCHDIFPIPSLSKHQKKCGRTMLRKVLSKARWEVSRCCFPDCSGEGNTGGSERFSML